MKQLAALIGIIIFIYACSPKPYAEANKSYKQQAKFFAKELLQKPATDTTDSIKQPAYFVGTTNFNLRKPSYVIIHHTAQNSCEQTLKTFTTVASKVSAHYVICKDGTIHHMSNNAGAVEPMMTILPLNSSFTRVGLALVRSRYTSLKLT